MPDLERWCGCWSGHVTTTVIRRVPRVTSQNAHARSGRVRRTTLLYFSEMTDVPCLAAHPIPEARPHPPSARP
eukprot:scaffold6352_cov67-Phaeocystis_antarctica.AAC.4